MRDPDPMPIGECGCLSGSRGRRLRDVPITLWAVIGCIFGANLVYLWIDTRPYNWDDSWYAEQAIRLNDAWVRHGVVGAFHYFINALQAKAPLVIALPQPLLLLFGRSEFVFGLTSAVALVIASVYLALLARLFVSGTATVVAVTVFSLMPLTSGMSRQFMVEMPLTALLLMFVYHLVRSDNLNGSAHAALVGVAAGLGLLAKITFPLFVAGLFVWLWVRLAREHRDVHRFPLALILALIGPAVAALGVRQGFPVPGYLAALGITAGIVLGARRRMPVWSGNLVLALSLAAWIPLPWYAKNAAIALEFAKSASIGEASKFYGSAEILSWAPFRDFWVANMNFGVGLVFVAGIGTLAALAILLALSGRGAAAARDSHRAPWVLLGVWVLPAVVAFSLGRNRQPRFLMPLLPAAGLLYAVIAEKVAGRRKWLAITVVVAHVVLASVVFLISSFWSPGLKGPKALPPVWALDDQGRYLVWAPNMSGRGAAVNLAFPLGAVLDQALRHTHASPERRAHATFLTDKPNVNLNSLALEAAKTGHDIDFNATAYQASVEQALGALPGADVLIFQEGGISGPDFTNRWGAEIRRRIDSGVIPGWKLNPDGDVALPDGGIVRFYERTGDGGDAAATPFATRVAFFRGRSYAMLGVALAVNKGTLQISTRWVKLREDAGRYLIAAHLIDESGRFAQNADFFPQGGSEAFARLKVGDSLTASTTVPPGEWSKRAGYLRLALHDLATRLNADGEAVDGLVALSDGWVRTALPGPYDTPSPQGPLAEGDAKEADRGHAQQHVPVGEAADIR